MLGKSDALAQVTRRVAESYKEYRKNLVTTGEALAQATGAQTGQIAKAQALAGIITDLSKSEKERKTALQELQSLDKERFKNFDIEKGKYDGIKEAVDGLTNSLIANAIANKLADRASDLAIQERQATNEADKLYLRQQELLRTNIDINDEVAKYKKALKSAKTADEFFRASIGVSEFAIELLQVNDKLANADLRASNLRKELAGLKVEIKGAVEEANKFSILDTPDAPKGRKIDFKFDLKLSDDYKELTDYNSLTKSIDRLKQYADVVLDVNKSEKERSAALAKLSEDSLNVYNINEDLFNEFKIGKTPLKDISQAVDIYSFKLQELIVAEIKFQQSLKDSQRLTTGFGATFKAQAKELTGANISDKISSLFNEEDFARIKDLAKDLPKTFLESFREFDGAFPSLEEFKNKLNEIIQLEFLKTGKLDLAQISELINAQLSKLKANVQTEINLNFDFDMLSNGVKLIEQQTEKIKNNITSAFSGVQNILQNTFFDLLDQGIANWKNFADEVIKEIKRIAAALLAKALVTGLANILAPGSGSAVSALLKGVDTESMGSWLDGMDSLGIPGSANFGGVRGADMAMSGQVVVSLRGSDLVGAINRTNTSINRVG